jgi:hypothetical protein
MSKLTTPVAVIKAEQGPRLVTYVTHLLPLDVITILGHDPRSKNWKKTPERIQEIYKQLQRKTSSDRAGSVAAYMEDRFNPKAVNIGGIPAISIAFADAQEFSPHKPGDADPPVAGELHLRNSPDVERVLIDGLGRVTGALDLLEQKGHQPVLFSFPVTIYCPAASASPLTVEEMGQLFADFNFRVHPVSRGKALSLDLADRYVVLARELMASEPLKAVAEFITLQAVHRAVRGACEGEDYQDKDIRLPEPNLTSRTFASIKSSITTFLLELAGVMGERFKDRDSIHLTAPGIQAIGLAYHDIRYKIGVEDDGLADEAIQIGRLDWSRGNRYWKTSGLLTSTSKKGVGLIIRGAGAGNNRQLVIKYIRVNTNIESRISMVLDVHSSVAAA